LKIFEGKIRIFIYTLLIRLSDLVFSGTITYSLVSDSNEMLPKKFAINSSNGVIVTTQILDRDEPAREEEVYLTVLATDNGRSQLINVCTFKVTIMDINDNNPVFDKAVRR